MKVESQLHSDVSMVTPGKRSHVEYPGEKLLEADEAWDDLKLQWNKAGTYMEVRRQFQMFLRYHPLVFLKKFFSRQGLSLAWNCSNRLHELPTKCSPLPASTLAGACL